MNLQSTNPVLAGDDLPNVFQTGGLASGRAQTATVQGVVNKTILMALMATASGFVGWQVTSAFPGALWIANITALVVVLGIFFALRGNPARAMWLGPIYAIVEGFLLGAVSMLFQNILAEQGIQVPGGIALQAFVVTIAILLTMLTLYSLGVLRGGETFTRILWVATAGIFVTYLVSFVLSLFGVAMPFLSLSSAMEGGSAALIGLGINAFILIIASLWFIVDFRQVEEIVAAGSPKSMEWYAAFGLIVTLAWVYMEALKMVFRVAMLFGRRD